VTGLFRVNNPYNNFLLFLYGFLLKIFIFIQPRQLVSLSQDGFFYSRIVAWSKSMSLPSITYSIIAFLLLYSQAIIINRLASGQRLLQKSSYVTGMAYLLFTSLFSELNYLSAPLLASSLLIWMLSILARLHHTASPKSMLFNIGIILGLGTLVVVPFFIFIILILLGIFIQRAFSLREWMTFLLGIIVPYYFLGSYIFFSGQMNDFSIQYLILEQSSWHFDLYGVISLSLVGLTMLSGLFFLQKNFSKQLMQTRKSWVLVLIMLVLSCIAPFFDNSYSLHFWVLVAAPFSLIASNVFFYPRKLWFPHFLHWSALVLVLITHYYK